VHALSTYPDEPAFQAADPRRRTSAELDLGATWRWAGSNDAWRLTWLRSTGELYLCRADSYDGSCTDVQVLAVLEREADLDVTLSGWSDRRTDPDGLAWLLDRVAPLAVAS
jgi:hypothetical protein